MLCKMAYQEKQEIQDKILDHMLITGKKVVSSDSDTKEYYWELVTTSCRKHSSILAKMDPNSEGYSYLLSLHKALTDYAIQIKRGRDIDLKDVFILSNISSI